MATLSEVARRFFLFEPRDLTGWGEIAVMTSRERRSKLLFLAVWWQDSRGGEDS